MSPKSLLREVFSLGIGLTGAMDLLLVLEKKKEKYFLKDYLFWVLSLVDWGSYMIAVLI